MATTPDPLALAMGRAVRSAAASRGAKLAALAARIDLAPNSMSRRINGHLPFTWPELVRISDALGLDLSDIIEVAEREGAMLAAATDTQADAGCDLGEASVA